MDLFDMSKPFERVTYPGGASQRYKISKADSDDDDDISMCTTQTGTDYVNRYIEEENQKYIEMISEGMAIGSDNNNEGVSAFSGMPNIAEVNAAELVRIYETFNFAHRPKSNLTVTSMKDRIVSMIEANQCVVIEGPTGCGKTTQVPQFILNSCFDKRKPCNIIVTQPRRIAAISIAKRVSAEREWPVGTLVGYQVGMVNNTSQDTRLTYCTTGVLLQKLVTDKDNITNYTHIILDEVHERDQDMDFLLLVVRKLSRQLQYQNIKVILMSATFNVDKFASYFSVVHGKRLDPAPVIDIAKKNYYNVNTFYLCQLVTLGPLPIINKNEPGVTPKMMRLCLNLIRTLDNIDRQESRNHHKKKDTERSVILIFLPGIFEIEEMYSMLTVPEYEPFCWDIVVMHSSITNEEQQKIFEMPPTGHRRIILSTNISESSITVPDVKYVIDFCLTKQLVTDPATNFQCLELVWASKANCTQRAGRTGRVMDGRVYRLVPKEFYDTVLSDEGEPEMLRAPLENIVLKTKVLNIGEPKAVLALSLDPPDLSNLERTILVLKEAGGLVDVPELGYDKIYDGHLTDLGRIMASLPVDIHISKLFMLGHMFSVLRECIIIGASMSVKSMFSTPFREKLKAYNAKLSWADSSGSDCVAYLNAYNLWIGEKIKGRLRTNAAEKLWAQRHFIQIRVLREVEALVQDIEKRLTQLQIIETVGLEKTLYSQVEKPLVIKIVIAGAFYPNYFVRRTRGGTGDETIAVKLVGGNNPANSVYLQGWPTRQPGLLYARQFQNLFKDCLDSPIVNTLVSFDGSNRVYIQFDKNHESYAQLQNTKVPSKICPSVYKAVKMRQNNVPMLINVLDVVTATAKAEELGLPTANITSFSRKENSKLKVTSRPALSPILPSLDVSYIPLLISLIEDPATFWAQIRDDETFDNLQRIREIIATVKENGPPMISELPLGSLVIAPFEEDKVTNYYRATILSYRHVTQGILVEVFFIDYGNVTTIGIGDLIPVELDNELQEIPSQAFKCVLSNIQPSMLRNLEGQWSDVAYEKFQKLLEGKIKLFGEIYSVYDSNVAMKLFRVDINNEKLDLNQWLLDQGFAEYKEESLQSRDNNKVRMQQANLNIEQQKYYEQQQYETNFENQEYPDDPSDSHNTETIKLKGPYSPLEMELINLATAGRTKKVYIEPNSVNSVLLDSDPADYHERLLIAGTVGQNVTGERLSLRNTTLMPNIYGLPSLVSLIFAPTIELRRSEKGSRYVGALCGLGYDPDTNRSRFPDHEMVIDFDVEINIDDFQKINSLRHWLNMGLQIPKTESDLAGMATCQSKAKQVLFNLIGKKRKTQEMQMTLNSARWNINDPNIILHPKEMGEPTSTIYKFHSALALEELPPGYEDMYIHLVELRGIASGTVVPEPCKTIECKLCGINIIDIPLLRIHLHSPDHQRRQAEANLQIC